MHRQKRQLYLYEQMIKNNKKCVPPTAIQIYLQLSISDGSCIASKEMA